MLWLCDRHEWERILEKNKWNEVDIRDNRYNQVIHLVTAARYVNPFTFPTAVFLFK
jgi:hypothetical protein